MVKPTFYDLGRPVEVDVPHIPDPCRASGTLASYNQAYAVVYVDRKFMCVNFDDIYWLPEDLPKPQPEQTTALDTFIKDMKDKDPASVRAAFAEHLDAMSAEDQLEFAMSVGAAVEGPENSFKAYADKFLAKVMKTVWDPTELPADHPAVVSGVIQRSPNAGTRAEAPYNKRTWAIAYENCIVQRHFTEGQCYKALREIAPDIDAIATLPDTYDASKTGGWRIFKYIDVAKPSREQMAVCTISSFGRVASCERTDFDYLSQLCLFADVQEAGEGKTHSEFILFLGDAVLRDRLVQWELSTEIVSACISAWEGGARFVLLHEEVKES